jgi:hypothetical protein
MPASTQKHLLVLSTLLVGSGERTFLEATKQRVCLEICSVAVADVREVVVPMIIPESSVASGRQLEANTALESRRTATAVKSENLIIVGQE